MLPSSTELSTVHTSMTIVERAIERGADMAIVEKLIDLQIRIDEREERQQMIRAKAAFRDAMAEFKNNAPEILKKRVAEIKKDGKIVGTYNFAELDDYSQPISNGLAAVGITHNYRLRQTPTLITIACVLSKGIYSTDPDDAELSCGPDTGGCKSPVQAIASTVSMLQKYTLCAATGMSAGMPDNDGNGGQPPVGVPSDVIAEKCEWMANAKDLEELKKLYMAAIALAEKVNDKNATQKFIAAKNLRYKELA